MYQQIGLGKVPVAAVEGNNAVYGNCHKSKGNLINSSYNVDERILISATNMVYIQKRSVQENEVRVECLAFCPNEDEYWLMKFSYEAWNTHIHEVVERAINSLSFK